MCKTSAKTADGNIPSHVHIENLKRLCGWLEELRERYNLRYVLPLSRGSQRGSDPPHCSPAQTTPNPSFSGGEASGRGSEDPIIINSGYRSEAVNKAVGGVKGSNHLTGCAADIRVAGIEQLIRYATILLDISDESQEDFDELLLERNKSGAIWLHFAVRPKNNRRKTMFLQK
ncbi:MAG: hypothetical protein IJ907_05855 [Prevotella sp.]|nr:hypothetical protein [Prevotella sp.]